MSRACITRLFVVVAAVLSCGRTLAHVEDKAEAAQRLTWAPMAFLRQGFRSAPWVRDPFFPAEEPFKLAGIISQELAFINGKWVREGDEVDGFKVKDIESEKVTLVRRSETIVLKLRE
jgi:hypothetical protein